MTLHSDSSSATEAAAPRSRIRSMTRTALMAAVLVICSQIAFPLPGGIPVTLQTFAIALLGGILGPGKGAAAVAVYLAMGAAGIPVFAGFKGGLDVLAGPTGGFLIGFLPMAALMGQSRGRIHRFLCPAAGLLACHSIGLIWLCVLTGLPLFKAFMVASLPFLLKDVLSVATALTLAATIRRRLNGRL